MKWCCATKGAAFSPRYNLSANFYLMNKMLIFFGQSNNTSVCHDVAYSYYSYGATNGSNWTINDCGGGICASPMYYMNNKLIMAAGYDSAGGGGLNNNVWLMGGLGISGSVTNYNSIVFYSKWDKNFPGSNEFSRFRRKGGSVLRYL